LLFVTSSPQALKAQVPRFTEETCHSSLRLAVAEVSLFTLRTCSAFIQSEICTPSYINITPHASPAERKLAATIFNSASSPLVTKGEGNNSL